MSLAVAWCGLCGSDLHEVADGPHAIPVDRPHGLSLVAAPITMGHEFSGVVVAVGSAVAGLGPGDRVAVEPNYRCGRCVPCAEGRYEVCADFGFAGLMGDGGLADYAVVPSYMVHRLPEDFDLAAAAVLEPAAVALHSVRQSAFRAGQDVLVVGLGPVGLVLAALLKLHGASTVRGRRPDPLAQEEGRGEWVSTSPSILPRTCRELAVAATTGQGVHVAFEVVGKQESIVTGLRSLRSGGELMVLGLTSTASIPVMEMVNAELRISTSVGYRDCHRELIDLVASGGLDLLGLVTRRVELDQAADVLVDLALHGSDDVKTLVRCRPDLSV